MNYINNKDFLNDVIKCKEKEELSKFAINNFTLLIEHLSHKYKNNVNPYYSDIIQGAWEIILRKWNLFDPEKSTNAFAYFTSMVRNALNESVRRQKKKEVLIEFDNSY